MTRQRTPLLLLALCLGLALVALMAARQAAPARTAPDKVTTVTALRLQAARGPVKNKVFHYKLPNVTSGTEFIVKFPGLPRDRYLASYNVAAQFTAPDTLVCYFRRPGNTPPPFFLLGYGASRSFYSVVSTTGVLNNTKKSVELGCTADTETFVSTAPPGYFSTVDFVRVDAIKTSSAAPVSPRGALPSGGIAGR